MHAPLLNELPPPPEGKTGWPWTEERSPLLQGLPDPSPYPRISIVTPSFNQGPFLEETIRSVLLQGYPNLEYFVIDGGSTDGSIEIIRKYETWITQWISEPDAGQTDAINKGIRKASGEILAWLNSDDVYCPGALQRVGGHFMAMPHIDLLYGDCEMIDEGGKVFGRFDVKGGDLIRLVQGNFISQPSAFCRREAWQKAGGLDQNLQFIMDYDLWLRIFLRGMRSEYIPIALSQFRYHAVSKSGVKSVQFGYEYLGVLDKISAEPQDRVILQARLQAYHQTFGTIIALHEQTAPDESHLREAVLRLLTHWSDHIKDLMPKYSLFPGLLVRSYYSIGRHYCLQGEMKEGKRYFALAFQINKGFPNLAIQGWIAACFGVRSFKSYNKLCSLIQSMVV